MNIKKFLEKAINMLSHLENPRYEVEILLGYVLKKSRISIIIDDQFVLNIKQYTQLKNFIYRRSIGEPIAYIIGKKEFWSLSLCVSYTTFIPRPDTEILVEKVISKIINNNVSLILDLGTGSGAIALALASIFSNCNVIGIDNSNEALKIARINALKLNLNNVDFFYSNWFSNIKRKFNIIVSNPPYISIKEIKTLSKDLFYEPFNALISKKNGLSDIELIISKAKKYLFFEGWLLIEHGWRQKLKVQFLFKKYNFFSIESFKDYSGHDRITIGQKKE